MIVSMDGTTYIVMRRDLGMTRGKEIAQACHAVKLLGGPDRKTVCVRAEDEAHFDAILAGVPGALVAVITDAGQTMFRGVPTRTCAAVGPVAEGQFPVLSEAKLY